MLLGMVLLAFFNSALRADPTQTGAVDYNFGGSPAGGTYVGIGGTGTLDFEAGVTGTTTGGVFVGFETSDSGTVIINGSGASWESDNTFYNGYGASTLGVITVSNGGTLITNVETFGTGQTNLAYGQNSVSSVTVTGAGSTWNSAGFITLGYNGTSTVNILNGGVFNNYNFLDGGSDQLENVFMGYLAGSNSTVNVDGAGSQWNVVGRLTVGYQQANATINLTNGGVLNVSSTETIGRGDGTIILGGTPGNNEGGSVGVLNIGTGGAPGIVQAATIEGDTVDPSDPAPDSTIIFDHNSAAYYFTSTGTAGGTAVNIGTNTKIQTLAGTTILTGTDTNSGATTVNGGMLQFAKISAMSNSSAITVNSGGTMAVNVGGSGDFTTDTSGNGSIGSVLSTTVFNSGSSFGVDTSDATGDVTYAGNVTNSGMGFIKLGTGTLILNGDNTYTGGTTVNQGNLVVGGSITGSLSVNSGSSFSVASGGALNGNAAVGGTLGGKGTINGNVTIQNGGKLYPGDPSVTTVSGSVNLMTGSTAQFAAANTATPSGTNKVTAGFDYDQVAIKDNGGMVGNLTIQSGVTLELVNLNSFQLNTVSYIPAGSNSDLTNYFVFALQGGTTIGEFDYLSDGTNTVTISYLDGVGTATIDSTLFYVTYTGDSADNSTTGGHDVVLTAYGAVPTPEPGTWAMLFAGLALLMVCQRRKKRNAA